MGAEEFGDLREPMLVPEEFERAPKLGDDERLAEETAGSVVDGGDWKRTRRAVVGSLAQLPGRSHPDQLWRDETSYEISCPVNPRGDVPPPPVAKTTTRPCGEPDRNIQLRVALRASDGVFESDLSERREDGILITGLGGLLSFHYSYS